MDSLREAILVYVESAAFQTVEPFLAGASLTLTLVIATMAIAREDILADVRRALQLSGTSEKVAAAERGVNQSVVCRQLSGEKPLAVTAMCDWSDEFWYWFAVRVAMRVRPPAEVRSGVHLSQFSQSVAVQSHEVVL